MADKPKEPATAPQAEQWYPIVLGSSFKDQSKHFYSLRYEFKPASIDTSKPGAMHKGAENKVTVELCNNQPGKPKVVFQGISEDCKDLDAILFFDGKALRLEKMHRAVKTLRHLRPGETSSLAASNPVGDNSNRSPFHLNGEEINTYKAQRDHVEEIVIGSQPESTGKRNEKNKKAVGKASPAKSSPLEKRKSPAPYSPHERRRTSPPMDEQLDTKRFKAQDNYYYQNNNDNVEHIDVNIEDEPAIPAVQEHESDYEVEDIEVSDEEEGQVKETAEPSSAGNESNNNNNDSKAVSSSDSQSSSSSSSESDGESSDGSDDESASLGEI